MVCVTPRAEPGIWLGDNITEAHPHQQVAGLPLTRRAPPHPRGWDRGGLRAPRCRHISSQSLPVGTQVCW